MTEDDIRLAMELFGGTGYNDPLSQYNRSREIPKPAPKRKSALDAARFPTLGRGTQPQIGLEPEFRDIDLKQREATIAGLSPLENLQAFGEGARTVGQAAVAGITQPFAELMGVPADKFYKAAIDLPETAGGIARGEQMIEGVQDFFGAMSESPLARFVEKIPPVSPYSPASAQAIDTGLAQAGKGLKLAGQQAKQAGRQTLEAGKDLAQAARAEFATPPTGAVQLQTQQATRNPLGMYSQAEQVALNLAQEKGTGNQFLAQISKAPGVKPAELEWTGLADFLKSKGDQPVTKKEIASHLMRNKVQVQEKQFLSPENYQRLLEDEAGIDLSVTLDPEGVPSYSVYDYPSDSYKTLEFRQLPEEVQDRLSFVQKRYGPAQFYEGDLQLPGGSNYREIALTLPGEELYRVPSAHSFDKQADVNRLVHMRVNDRLDANGDKVLFVEEMQSDWGQKGKKKGFTPKGQTKYGPEFIATSKDGRQFDFYDAGRAQEWLDSQGGGELKKIPLRDTLPSAPFVQNTEDWVNLSLKRLITDAVNNGYKKVAFINGDQSASRYDLSKQIDEVYYLPKTNTLVAKKGGEDKFNQTVPADKLADYIGKEAAEKLLAAPTSQNLSGSPMQRLSGVDLKVGGEGMKKFYDQIVPATANKLLKKLGGGKLEPIEIGAPIETELSITDMLKDLNIPEQKWLDMPWEEKSKLMDDFAAQNKQRKITQLGFTITPEMVELVKKQGLPMFAAGGAVTMAKGGNPLKAAREGMQAAKKAMKAQRREERVQKNLEAYMGSKEKPKTYYHATQAPEDFEAFDLEKRPTKRSASAVFVTPSTDWASDWAKDELVGMDVLEKVDTPKPRIMPVITRAKNTFDYENPEHVEQVMSQAKLPESLDRQHVADQISIGNWNFIEDRNIQQAIKDLGFDSFNIKEKGVKNMGIFNPADVKALFNRGSYDPTTADISKADGGKISADDIRQKLKNAFNFAGGGKVEPKAEEPKAAAGGTSNTLLERLRKYKIGGAVEGAQKGMKAASKAMKAAKPAQAAAPAKTESVIEDWQWRPTEQVTAEVGLKEVPDYIQGGYGEFMKGQQKRAQAGQMGVRDLIKAYTITRSSVNRSGLPRDTATKTGMKIPPTDGLVRPEGAFAEWLGSKQGQNYLKAADRGEIDEKAIADLQTKFAPFGMASVLADDMRWAVKNAPTLASNLSQTIVGDPQTYRSVSQQLQGIGPAKSGFLGSLVGRGDFPTLDARQLRLHTGAGGAEASKFMRRRGGLGGEQAVGRLAGRQEGMGLDIDPSLNPFYQHLTHHAVWDKVADEQTTHDDLVRAMMGYKDGGEVKLSRGGGDLLGRMEKGLRAAQKGTEKKAKKDKPPPKFEPAPAIPKEQIRSMAERIAQQTTGEFVRQNPKTTTNPEGLSKVQFERTKAVKPNIKYNVPQKDAPVVDIEKYKDYLLVGVPGDITPGGVISDSPLALNARATQELLGIDDVEFETPVGMYGGSRYGQESVFPEGLEAFWASGLSPARALQNSITRFSEAEGGRPVLGMFSKMSRPASSFSGHLMEGLLEYQHPERLPKKKIKELNEIVRRGTPSQQFPDFVGFEDPEKLRIQAMKDGKLRTHIDNVLTMATLNKQLGLDPKKGLRSGLDVSAAMTIPDLSGLEVGASGYSLGRMVPGADLRLSAHPTYSHDIPGEFLGRMPYHIPYELAFPRTTHFVRENIPRGELFNTMKGTGMKEQIDQQYIDQIKLYQQYMKELTGRKKGGLAKIKKAKVKNGN